MKRGALAAILGLVSVAAAGVYLAVVGPVVNAPLGLSRFDEERVRERVLLTAQRLLDSPGPVELRLSASTDTETLRRLQRLVGLSAASYWGAAKLPIQQWSYRVVPRRSLAALDFREDRKDEKGERGSVMTVDVSSSGQILGLEIGAPPDRPPVETTHDEARRKAEDLLRFLGVDVGALALTAYNAGEVGGRQRYDFAWRAPIQGLPAVVSEYSVTLEGGYIRKFDRKVRFEAPAPPDPGVTLVLPLFAFAAWFFLALLTLFLFVQKLRRDEVDFQHVKKVFFTAGGLAFFASLFDHDGQWAQTLLAAVVVSVLSALFFALLWTVGESFLRQAFPEKLAFTDLVLDNTWRVREVGAAALWCGAAGLALLALPDLLYALAIGGTGSDLVLLPASARLQSLTVPGGLAVQALVGPVPWVVMLGLVFLGVLYPFLRLRFRPAVSGPLFCALFGAAAAVAVPVGPASLAFACAVVVGVLLFAAMELGGLLCGFLLLYGPLVVLRAGLLLTAQQRAVSGQGAAALVLLAAGLLAAAWLAWRGRPLEDVQPYEPAYLTRLRERERFARELEIAKSLQERFLPRETPAIPGFTLAARCTPAMEVGGDYFDYLPLARGRWLIILGDVSGKGVKAAFYMTLTKGILHAVSSLEQGHTEIISHLNRLFGKLSDDGTFLTLCAVVLDPTAREATILSAGHNPPVLVRRGSARALSPRGLVLGLMPDEVFLRTLENCTVSLEPGDALVLYTDGVTEAMDRRQEEFELDRLLACLEGCSGLSAEVTLDRVAAAVHGFCGDAPQADDLTLLVLKVHEA